MSHHKLSYEAVLFDLDGTLLDTLADLGESVNRVLESLGFSGHSIDSYRFRVGNGVRKLVERSLPPDRQEVFEQALTMQKEHYRRFCTVHTRPYPGVIEILKSLKASGLKLAVLSNKPHDLTCYLVDYYFGDQGFDLVCGHQDGRALKPDPGSALGIAAALGVRPDRMVFVGDSAMDMETALAAEMVPIGVLWGFRPKNELIKGGAARLAANCEDLLKCILST